MNSEKLADFKVFKLKYLEQDDENTAHEIFIQKFRSQNKSSNKPVGKTVLVLNIPPYASKESLYRVFSLAGDVEKVILADSNKYDIPSTIFKNLKLPFKFTNVYIVFKKASSLDLLFTLSKLPALNSDNFENLMGIDKLIAEHNQRYVNIDDMKSEVEEYMKHYNKIITEEQEDPDEDSGWVQVGKKGFRQNEAVIQKLQKVNKQSMFQTPSMYSFEMRENKKLEILKFKKKFEEDASKLNIMKQNRKFKPY